LTANECVKDRYLQGTLRTAVRCDA